MLVLLAGLEPAQNGLEDRCPHPLGERSKEPSITHRFPPEGESGG